MSKQKPVNKLSEISASVSFSGVGFLRITNVARICFFFLSLKTNQWLTELRLNRKSTADLLPGKHFFLTSSIALSASEKT